jgi:hypothetical protein
MKPRCAEALINMGYAYQKDGLYKRVCFHAKTDKEYLAPFNNEM